MTKHVRIPHRVIPTGAISAIIGILKFLSHTYGQTKYNLIRLRPRLSNFLSLLIPTGSIQMSVDKYAHYNYIKNAPQSKEDLNTSYVSFDRVHITWFSVLFSKLYTFRNACSYYIFNDRLKTYLFKIFCTVNSVIFGSLLQYSFFRSITSYWRLFAIISSPTGYTEKFSVSFRLRPLSIIFKGTNSVTTTSDYWTAKWTCLNMTLISKAKLQVSIVRT